MATASTSHTSSAARWGRPLSIVLVVAVLAAVAAMYFGPASAPTVDTIESDAQRVFTNVMSPFCPGMTMATCTSSNAADVREEVRARLRKGESAQAIEDSLYARFGNEYRAVPQAEGRGMIVWLFPLAAMVLSGIGVAWLAKRARDRHVAEPVADAPLDPKLARRLEDELDEL